MIERKIIHKKGFAGQAEVQRELDRLYSFTKLISVKLPMKLKIRINQEYDSIDAINKPSANCIYMIGNRKNPILFYSDSNRIKKELIFAKEDSATKFIKNLHEFYFKALSQPQFPDNYSTGDIGCAQYYIYFNSYLSEESSLGDLPQPVIDQLKEFYKVIGHDVTENLKTRRHYQGNLELLKAMNHLVDFMLRRGNKIWTYGKTDHYKQLREHFEAVDAAAKNYKSNNTPKIWVSAAAVIGAIIGTIIGFGIAALVTFLTGGLALPVAALIGISVGAAVGALTGGLGMYHGKAKHFKQSLAHEASMVLGKEAGKVALYLREKLPENFDEYKNSFIYLHDKSKVSGGSRTLYCIDEKMKIREIPNIKRAHDFDTAVKLIQKSQKLSNESTTLHITNDEWQSLFYENSPQLTESQLGATGFAKTLADTGYLKTG